MNFKCIHCDQSLEADPDMGGTSVTCPSCSKDITVPVLVDQPIKIERVDRVPVSPAVLHDTSPLNTGLQPRSYFGTASMLFGVTALPFALGFGFLLSLQTGMPLGKMLGISNPAGLIFGLIFGLIMAAFLKADTITVNVQNKEDFVTRINVAMSQIGFNPATTSDNFLTFKPSFQAGLMAGRFAVSIQGFKATIVGPCMHLKKIRERLA